MLLGIDTEDEVDSPQPPKKRTRSSRIDAKSDQKDMEVDESSTIPKYVRMETVRTGHFKPLQFDETVDLNKLKRKPKSSFKPHGSDSFLHDYSQPLEPTATTEERKNSVFVRIIFVGNCVFETRGKFCERAISFHSQMGLIER